MDVTLADNVYLHETTVTPYMTYTFNKYLVGYSYLLLDTQLGVAYFFHRRGVETKCFMVANSKLI